MSGWIAFAMVVVPAVPVDAGMVGVAPLIEFRSRESATLDSITGAPASAGVELSSALTMFPFSSN